MRQLLWIPWAAMVINPIHRDSQEMSSFWNKQYFFVALRFIGHLKILKFRKCSIKSVSRRLWNFLRDFVRDFLQDFLRNCRGNSCRNSRRNSRQGSAVVLLRFVSTFPWNRPISARFHAGDRASPANLKFRLWGELGFRAANKFFRFIPTRSIARDQDLGLKIVLTHLPPHPSIKLSQLCGRFRLIDQFLV